MKIRVISKREKPFKGSEGDMIPYFWYRLTDADGAEFEAGSLSGEGTEGETYLDADVVKVLRGNGKTGWSVKSFGK